MLARIAGHYEILEKLGEGGMGEVYKARDTRLNRFVAIKALPPGRVGDPDRRARFIQEARAASALNHPNIVTVHDIVSEDGCDFLVMEFIAGETLAQHIARQELRLPRTLKYSIQIADALARAHAAGIVHRDLKPANVMIAGDGVVKVLDFGLAKLSASAPAADEATATMPRTAENMVVGTTGYMSPEQVRGQPVDHRSDLFSFGLVLYEMLSGKRAFQGPSAMDVMTAILKEDPPELPDSVPPALRQIVAGCLEKEPAARFESARDLAFSLRALSSGSGLSAAVPVAAPSTPAAGRHWLVPALASAVVVLAALAAALYLSRPAPLDLSAIRFRPFATDAAVETMGSWSPDGRSVTYLETVDGQFQVMVRGLDSPSPTSLTKLPSGVYRFPPFYAPDGQRIWFIASGAVWSVSVVGGEPREVLRGPIFGAALSPDGKTLALWQRYEDAGRQYGSVWISSPPGAPPRMYQPAPFRVAASYVPDFLRFSPDGSQIALARYRVPGEAEMWLLSWPDGPRGRPRRLFSQMAFHLPPAFAWFPDCRHICLSFADDLWLGDSRTGKLQRLTVSPIGTATFPSASPDGQRVLFTAEVSDYDAVEIPLDGSAPRTLLATARRELSPSWSARGDRMAFITDRSGETEIWLRDPDGGWERPVVRQSDFPSDPGYAFQCVALSPDGSRLAYNRHGHLWVSPVSGGRASPAAVAGEHEIAAPSWSPDGSSLTFLGGSGGRAHVAIIRVGSQEPQVLLPGTAGSCTTAPAWSPDGRWIACGGGDGNLLLMAPDGHGRRLLPSPVKPAANRFVLVWSRDSETLYLASSASARARLDAVDLRTSKSRLVAEYPREWIFGAPSTYSLSGSLSADGRSFATTVLNTRSDLWLLDGLPRLRVP